MPRKAQPGFFSPSQRAQLPKRYEPHWFRIGRGLFVGYRSKTNAWIMRRAKGKGYEERAIGVADNDIPADGVHVLTYEQARDKVLKHVDSPLPSSPYKVGETCKDYLRNFKLRSKSYDATELTINAHILPRFRYRRVDRLTTSEINDWLNDLVTAPVRLRTARNNEPNVRQVNVDDPEAMRKRKATANRILTVFKAALNHAFENKPEITDDSIWRKVKPFKNVDEARKIFLTNDQCRRLINACKDSFRELVQAALYTGMRPGEPWKLRVHDFDKDQGVITIPDSKTGPRVTFLSDEGIAFFSRLTAGRSPDEFLLTRDNSEPWKRGHHQRVMQDAVRRAKLPRDTTFYSLRHTYISLAIVNGVNLKVLADSTGTSIRMLEKYYAKVLNKDRRDMINQAAPGFGFEVDNVAPIA